MRFPVLTSAALGLLAALPTFAQRLPAGITPEHYDLSFVVDLSHDRFEGTETIRVAVAEPTSRVVLHAVDLDLREITIGTGASAQKATATIDEESQTATLAVTRPLAKGATDIHLRFGGV